MKVGDKVRVKGTDHITTIVKRVDAGWFILKKRLPKHCCNYYGSWELQKIKPVNN